MRLIDADALMNTLQELFDKREKEQKMPLFMGSRGAFVTWNDAICHFKTAPTIDAVPVKHGEWIDDGGLYRCSCCNHLWSELWWVENCPIERMLKIMPYCPNCGAKMEG